MRYTILKRSEMNPQQATTWDIHKLLLEFLYTHQPQSRQEIR